MKPAIGLSVLFHPISSQTHNATIAHVHTDTMVDVDAVDQNGSQYKRSSVTLVQRGEQPPEFAQWCEWPMTIGADQLRIAPPVDVCYELLTHMPEQRKVTEFLTVSFKGREFDVRSVPQVMVGEKLDITLNPYALDSATVVLKDTDGNELLHSIPLVARNEDGFRDDANVIGEGYVRHADTVLEINRKEVHRAAYDAQTDTEADAKAKAGVTPFGSRIDPYKVMEQAPQRTLLRAD